MLGFALLLFLQAAAPDGMVFLPGGTFWMGTDRGAIEEKYKHLGPRLREMLHAETPRRKVTVEPFYVDRYEVTNRQFQRFVDANPPWRPDRIDPRLHNGDYLKHWNGGYPPGHADHPVVYVSWHAAMAYAAWAGKRLPTEAEWEYAARGGFKYAEYPWGNATPTPDLANYGASGVNGTKPVGSYSPNGFGLYDMAGNVWEFTAEEWRDSYDSRQVSSRRAIRGGSWGGAPVNLRVAFRDSHPAEGAGPHVGFRCVRSATR